TLLKIQIKHCEIQEKKCFDYENGCVLDNPDYSHDREKELCVKNEPEVFDDAGARARARARAPVECMPHHKPDDCKKCRGGKDIMCRVLFRDENHAENPGEEDDDDGERPSLTMGFVKHSERRHYEHTQCDKVSRLEYRGGGNTSSGE
ncbi:MAG: hypothetical protein EBU66_17585, partial [Bacteroidetes bacterium]|nr:hypothetical protein [Bacteroidota bacterium]